jgi:hypothetical protein
MTHYYERNIVDIKKEYTEYLVDILSPFLYQGYKSMYMTAVSEDNKHKELSKDNPNIKSLGVLIYFQMFLKDVQTLNVNIMEKETARIRNLSKCADIFDDLIKSVIKSYIVLLTYTSSGRKCRIIHEKYHQRINISTFIHTCYIECSRLFYDHCHLFWHELESNQIKQNQQIIYQLIKVGILKAIKIILPMKSILEEYLKNDYIDDNESEYTKHENIKKLLKKENYTGYENMIESDKSIQENLNQDKFEKSENKQSIASPITTKVIQVEMKGNSVHSQHNNFSDTKMKQNLKTKILSQNPEIISEKHKVIEIGNGTKDVNTEQIFDNFL